MGPFLSFESRTAMLLPSFATSTQFAYPCEAVAFRHLRPTNWLLRIGYLLLLPSPIHFPGDLHDAVHRVTGTQRDRGDEGERQVRPLDVLGLLQVEDPCVSIHICDR